MLRRARSGDIEELRVRLADPETRAERLHEGGWIDVAAAVGPRARLRRAYVWGAGCVRRTLL